MSEAEIVRLVRCPKCQNLLPELAGYSVYQCGGCGAVLAAKLKLNAKDSAEKSGQEKIGGYEKLGDLSGKEAQENVKSSSDTFVTGNHSSNEDTGSDCVAIASNQDNDVKMDKYPNPRQATNNESVANVDASLSVSVGKLEKLGESLGNASRSRGSEQMSRLRRKVSGHYENVRDDDPSNYSLDSGGNNVKLGEDVNVFNMCRNTGDLQKDRAELLQMMEELSEQLRLSGNLGEKMKDKSPMNRNAAYRECSKSSTSALFNNNDAGPSAGMREGSMPDKPTISPHRRDPYYFHRHPHGGRETNGVHNLHHFPHGLCNDVQTMRGTLPNPCPFEHQFPYPFYYQGQPFTDYPAVCVPNSNNGLPHRSVCSFYNCCSDHHIATQPDYLDDTRFYDVHNNPVLYPPNVPGPSTRRDFSRKTSALSSTLVDRSVQKRLADRDMRRYTHGYVRRQQEKGKLQPIASGAPFVICQSCSKLLQLPKLTFKLNRKHQILCCGACNTVMVCTVINGKFSISVSGESKKIVKGAGPHRDDLTHEGNSSELCWAKMKSVSDDFYSSSHESHVMNGNSHVTTRGLDLTSNETDSPSLPGSSPASDEGVESLENLASLSPYDQIQQDQLSNPFNANVTSRVWKGSQSTRSDHEKVMPKDMISRQNSLNETSTTAQMEEISFKVYSKTGVSEKSEPTTFRNNTEKIKGSSFAGAIKKSFKALSRSNHSADSRDRNVTVNGFKISERLLKKAEKLAGPIQSGNYWYDFRAGFWGVIDGPCLGIIPPCIEEFNYPMAANCSRGATGVFVNGRELQQIDLDLLANRGLPTDRGRSYVIEISGKVTDKDSGEELDGLGKLAPTIEKVKHGFGMKPRNHQ